MGGRTVLVVYLFYVLCCENSLNPLFPITKDSLYFIYSIRETDRMVCRNSHKGPTTCPALWVPLRVPWGTYLLCVDSQFLWFHRSQESWSLFPRRASLLRSLVVSWRELIGWLLTSPFMTSNPFLSEFSKSPLSRTVSVSRLSQRWSVWPVGVLSV